MNKNDFSTMKIEIGIWVKSYDKRCDAGFKIKNFESKEITNEIIEYVRKHPNVFKIYGPGFYFYTREEFLNKFNNIKRKNI